MDNPTSEANPQLDAIRRAVGAFKGTQTELAKTLGITVQAVNQWLSGTRPVPAHHCRGIEKACGREVTVHELRPDVFGPAKRRA